MTPSLNSGSSAAWQWAYAILVILASSICWYLGNGINGDAGWLVWLAPVLPLVYSFDHPGRRSFLVSFLSCLVGRLSWLAYLASVVNLIPAILFCIVLALVYAVLIGWASYLVKTQKRIWTILAFPILFTAFEFLLFKFSPDGTAASLAYSQSNYISILQLASLTGITGISFLLTLVPSAIAVNWWFWRKNRKSFAPLAIAGMILLMAIGFGYYRSLEVWKTRTISVGLVSMPEESHDMSAFPDSARTAMNLARYDSAISSLARRGAKLVVLPERALYINRTNENVVMNALLKRAAENNIFIVAGYTNQKNSTERNSSLVIDDSGRLVCDYNKIHLVKGLEKRFTPGGSIATYSMVSILAGTAICKDLDFPDNIIDYGRSGVSLLAVPAWDFGQDGWLHSRMAVLRGLENGFSVARSARQGRLTLSDGRGHILSETSTARGQEAFLVGQLPLSQVPTLYRRWGDWFGWLNLFGLVILLGISGRIILSNSRPNQNRTSSK